MSSFQHPIIRCYKLKTLFQEGISWLAEAGNCWTNLVSTILRFFYSDEGRCLVNQNLARRSLMLLSESNLNSAENNMRANR
uniref:Uncharacterized protein n=1 Tax=Arundo donax TaxID=35708 RepID=A0A0A9H3W1_ARUDO